MTGVTLFDHLMVLLLAVILPLGGNVSMRQLRRRIDAGYVHTRRVTDYRNNMLIMWLVTACTVALWMVLERDLRGLGIAGIDAGAGPATLALLLAALLVGTNLYFSVRVRKSGAAADELVRQTRRFDFMLPHTRRELRWFYGVSFTAGITEEVLYRGFLITYCNAFMPLPAAMILASLAFAGAHGYQGFAGAVRAFIIALVLAAIFVMTKSILLAAVAHVLVDAVSGRMIYRVYRRPPPAATAQEAC